VISASKSGGPPAFQFKAARQPLLWAAAAYAAGIVVGSYAWRPATWWLFAAVAFLAAAAYFAGRRAGLGWIVALAAFVLAGALHVQMKNGSPKLDTSIAPFADRQEVQITGHVIRDGRLQAGGFGETRQTLDMEAEELRTDTDVSIPSHSRIRLSVYFESEATRFGK
jgi:uncharacterized protein (DUF58 family)